ncbi:hypothetical protein Glove_575g18 [Diversispora epigaea]|uniref:BZIP domain-containing protein n=1 Tax=Diversispora epigaea TaxID=1348612 RepID=A0A397GE20_9GLOM|nr:hypothetical protein Glove_575g18 [Diversispora epigaea]
MSNNTQPSQMSSTSTSQPRKLPISPPISSNSRFDISSYSNPLPLISCQQTIPVTPVGRPTPNKRGRKPLATMPVAKKHIQNLNNQRAFRQRRDHYLKNLEVSAKKFEQEAKNLGILYSRAQNEIKSLKEKLALFEKQISRYQGNNLCDGELNMTSTDIHTISGMIEDTQMNESQIYQEINNIQKEDNNSCDVMNDTVMNTTNYCSDNNQISSSSTRSNRILPTYQQECLSSSPKSYCELLPLETYAKSCYPSTLNQRNLSSFIPATVSPISSSFNFNNNQSELKDNHNSMQISLHHQDPKNSTTHSSNSSMSMEDTINSTLFCEDLCYYRTGVSLDEGLQLNDDDDTKNQSQLPMNNGRYLKMGRKICVIFPKHVESESSPMYSDCEPTSEESGSQWQLQQEGDYYFTQSPNTVEAGSQSHHIKWLLENDEQNSDDL